MKYEQLSLFEVPPIEWEPCNYGEQVEIGGFRLCVQYFPDTDQWTASVWRGNVLTFQKSAQTRYKAKLMCLGAIRGKNA